MQLHATNLWSTIDKLADREGLTLPRLALKAGLDQSTFSHARRKRNWMSLQTLTKVLIATNTPPVEWAKLIDLDETETNPPYSRRQ